MQSSESGSHRPATINQHAADGKHTDAVWRMFHWVWQATWTMWPITLLGAIFLAIIIWFAVR